MSQTMTLYAIRDPVVLCKPCADAVAAQRAAAGQEPMLHIGPSSIERCDQCGQPDRFTTPAIREDGSARGAKP